MHPAFMIARQPMLAHALRAMRVRARSEGRGGAEAAERHLLLPAKTLLAVAHLLLARVEVLPEAVILSLHLLRELRAV